VLLPKVAESAKIPILATGGMVDGKSMAAALCLGADGIMMATRFLASEECWVHENIKNWIVQLNETDTDLFCHTTLQARGVKNSVLAKVNELEKNGAEPSEIVRAVSGKKLLQALQSGDTEGAAFLFGQSIGRIHEIKSCKAIIDDTMAVCEETLRTKAALV
jgi:nitronate monooxygenase